MARYLKKLLDHYEILYAERRENMLIKLNPHLMEFVEPDGGKRIFPFSRPMYGR
jgi:hypothetical protein